MVLVNYQKSEDLYRQRQVIERLGASNIHTKITLKIT